MPKSSTFLGVLPRGACLDFPLRQELNWRLDPFSGPIEELGTAPSGAYLAMTKEQMTFAFFRVSRWEVTYSFGPVSLSPTLVIFDGDTGETTETVESDFSFPLVEVARDTQSRLLSPDEAERLACRNFFELDSGALPDYFSNNVPTFFVTSSDILYSEGSDPFPTNYSRSTSVGEISFNDTSAGQEAGNWSFDQGQVGNLYYATFIVRFDINVSDEVSDGLLFNESADAFEPEPGSGFLLELSGTLPRIAGRLTTFPLPNASVRSLTPHKLRFQFSSESDFIELPLYDTTPELTALTNTAFNLEGFSGITIKPKEYFSYDPQDGGGPIYDSATGVRLREF